jgi:galactokinase
VRAFRAPGRVNLIGEHTDYNDGFVLPLAIDLECVVRASPAERIRVRSRDVPGEVDLAADGTGEAEGWGRTVAAVARVLAELGRPGAGIDAEVASTVPQGSGLSSSAALEVAVALALCDAAAFELPAPELALACSRAERLATGVPTGIMDQLASLAGRAGHALLIDCRKLEVEPVPLPEGLAVLVVHSGVSRELAGSAYADRRAACEAAAERLGVAALRDATPEQVADDPRARHVVSENARVLAAVDALHAGDTAALGRVLAESHASLRDDFEVSVPELDALTAALEDAGAAGARLTGAGFGGAVVAVCADTEAERILGNAALQYERKTGIHARRWIVRAVDGAGRIPA